MIFNQAPRGLLAMLAAAAVVAGCAGTPQEREEAATGTAAPQAVPAAEPTATELALAEEAASSNAPASSPAPEEEAPGPEVVQPEAPQQYTVKRGDTLWGIASMFLKDPWLWPEIWYVNPKVANPHRIYPGDVLVLAYGVNGKPRITIAQASPAHLGTVKLEPTLRSTPLDDAIPTIPYSAIAAFLSRPTVLAAEQIRHAPYVLAFPDGHQAAGDGQVMYARGLTHAPAGARYSVIHVDEPIYDPDGGRLLGYQGIYTATATVQNPGAVTKTLLVDSARETLAGDCLLPDAATTPLTFTPRLPTQPVRGRIISVIDSVNVIGQFDIVAINRGLHDGVDAGTILAADVVGDQVVDHGAATYDFRDPLFAGTVRLPTERAGTLLVFKSYDHMSFALVVGESRVLHVADVVHNP
ncbi:MAG TPA: LysM peptidoglycan-binding domain-containing protein [Steroidobacteraceae bacterium]|nr:LysM peptidoglycan-binding domain-containing protein [Steroidobacteraceae bacterium]